MFDGGNIKFSRLQESQEIDVSEVKTTIATADGDTGKAHLVKSDKKFLNKLPWRSLCIVIAMFCMVLIISYNRKDINSKYATVLTLLNHSAALHNSYKSELQKVGGKVNIVLGNLSRIGKL